MNERTDLTKEILEELYLKQKLSEQEIARRLCTGRNVVARKLKKYNIPKRPKKQSLIGDTKYKLTVIDNLTQPGDRVQNWLCQCQCGKTIELTTERWNLGNTHSCGDGRCRSQWAGHGDISMSYWTKVKRGAEIRDLEFSISIEYAWNLFLEQNRLCALSKVPLFFVSGFRQGKQNASLDRINNTKGYIEGNVRWVHKIVNHLCGVMTDKELIKWCYLIYTNNDTLLDLMINIEDSRYINCFRKSEDY